MLYSNAERYHSKCNWRQLFLNCNFLVCSFLIVFNGSFSVSLNAASFVDITLFHFHKQVLHVVREIDRIIYDVSHNNNENLVLDDEKNLNYDIGYLAPDYSLKPLVELERVRASGDKRLSKASSRNSAYSLLEGGDSDSCKNGDGGVFPGLIMMSICVTGHSLSGQRSEALASLIRNHNCICELRMGKTQLCGEDVSIIAKSLEENRTIHSLDLRLNNIGQKGAIAVADLLLKTKSLRLLNLSSTNMDLRSIKKIVGATAGNKCLTDLDLSFLDIGDECCECLRDMLRANTNLQKLRLRSNNLTWSGCYVIAEGLSHNLCLNVLDLSRNTIGDEGVQVSLFHIFTYHFLNKKKRD